MSQFKWKFIGKVKGCHRFWRELNSDRIGVCDMSSEGRNPEFADDGALFLDQDRPILLYHSSHGIHVSIPLLTPDGKETYTGGTLKEARYIMENFGGSIKIEELGTISYKPKINFTSFVPVSEDTLDITVDGITSEMIKDGVDITS
jgi:hypothetical protein